MAACPEDMWGAMSEVGGPTWAGACRAGAGPGEVGRGLHWELHNLEQGPQLALLVWLLRKVGLGPAWHGWQMAVPALTAVDRGHWWSRKHGGCGPPTAGMG